MAPRTRYSACVSGYWTTSGPSVRQDEITSDRCGIETDFIAAHRCRSPVGSLYAVQ